MTKWNGEVFRSQPTFYLHQFSIVYLQQKVSSYKNWRLTSLYKKPWYYLKPFFHYNPASVWKKLVDWHCTVLSQMSLMVFIIFKTGYNKHDVFYLGFHQFILYSIDNLFSGSNYSEIFLGLRYQVFQPKIPRNPIKFQNFNLKNSILIKIFFDVQFCKNVLQIPAVSLTVESEVVKCIVVTQTQQYWKSHHHHSVLSHICHPLHCIVII